METGSSLIIMEQDDDKSVHLNNGLAARPQDREQSMDVIYPEGEASHNETHQQAAVDLEGDTTLSNYGSSPLNDENPRLSDQVDELQAGQLQETGLTGNHSESGQEEEYEAVNTVRWNQTEYDMIDDIIGGEYGFRDYSVPYESNSDDSDSESELSETDVESFRQQIEEQDSRRHRAAHVWQAGEHPLWKSHLSQSSKKLDCYQRDVEEIGADLQGILFGEETDSALVSRRLFKHDRGLTYPNHENCVFDHRQVLASCDEVVEVGLQDYYERHSKISVLSKRPYEIDPVEEDPRWLFHPRLFTRLVHPYRAHYQLRHTVLAISPSDVLYLARKSEIRRWSSPCTTDQGDSGSDSLVLKLTESTESAENERVRITTFDASDQILAVGGYDGEVCVMNMNQVGEVVFKTHLCDAITNSVQIGENSILCANNDKLVRLFDLNLLKSSTTITFDACPNRAIASPLDARLLAVGLDAQNVQLCDLRTGETIGELVGHQDFVFGLDWHPNGIHLATGAQDKTTRIWDIRMMHEGLTMHGSISHSLAQLRCLHSKIASLYAVHYSACGKFLCTAEAVDYVHMYKVGHGNDIYQQRQTVADVIGEITGQSWVPDNAQRMFIGVSQHGYSGILELESDNSISFDEATRSD